LVSNVILELKLGKAADFTGVTAEHLHYSHPIISVLLSYLFQLMFSFHYIPAGSKYSYIVPSRKPKDVRARALTWDDFRAITISPIALKVFEYCILNHYSNILYSADNQFGFKKSLGCSHAIYAIRSIVEYFTRYASTVNLCAIDLSKAFD